MITTILFDNDGVLVDTERLYMQATREVLATVGVDLTVELYISHSLTRGLNTMALAAASGATATEVEVLRAKRNARYAELLHQTHCVIDGIEATLQSLHGRFRMGVVTGSRRDHFEIIHQKSGLLRYFDFHVTREDYENSKPAPDAYLEAMKRRTRKKEHCIAIEDSPRGCEAAVAAGLRCLVIPTALTKRSSPPAEFGD
jgi:HAD superfamily hydrolase (TIGR01509 family)